MAGQTLYDKLWNAHEVTKRDDGSSLIYIDRHLLHEVTSPQAFEGLELANREPWRLSANIASPDHNVPTVTKERLEGVSGIKDKVSRLQVLTLDENCSKFDIAEFTINDARQGILHVVGPEQGLVLPGMTVVCGDSHTATHGALGCLAHGIGTSEVEHVLATQCLIQKKSKNMQIRVSGKLGAGVTSKDVVLAIIAKIGTAGGTGYAIEFAGQVFEDMSMEGRMTVCNMSIEMGARGGMIAPDETTFEYVKGRKFAPKGEAFDKKVAYWKTLPTDDDAVFDKEYHFDAEDIEPMLTYGTNPGMGIKISEFIPETSDASFEKALDYMNFKKGETLIGKPINFVFIGSCTNSRIEDFRIAADYIKGKRKADNVTAWLVPGSKQVETQIIEEGLKTIFDDAGFELRQPGCSACLAMNDDKIPQGEYCVSTSNRNFEGRQGQGARTILASPLMAAATAVEGKIIDITKQLN